MIRSIVTIAVCCLFAACAAAQTLEPLKYNNPGLVVDLGVGLWAWPVPCDADGDGDYDLIVSCPDKPSNGVWLFENATGDTSKNPLPVFKPARKLSKTVHYVMPSYVDGKLRVLSPGFEYKNFEKTGLDERVALPVDAKSFFQPVGKQPKGPKVRHNQWRYVDYDGDGALDLVTGIEDWSDYGWDDAWDENGKWKNGLLHGFVLVHRNTGTTEKPKYETPFKVMACNTSVVIWNDMMPVDTFGCPSPNFADFDGDGDLDLLCGEFLDGFTYFENTGTRRAPNYLPGVRLRRSGGKRLAMNLEMIVPVAFDWDRDGDLDLVVGDEDGRVAFVENVGLERQKKDDRPRPAFAKPRYFQQEADTLKCGALATPFAVDWDDDGDIDILSGNTAGYIEYFENLSGPKVASPKWAAPQRLLADSASFRIMAGKNGSIQGPAEAKWGYTTFNVADWDGDGLHDVLVNSIWGKVIWLKNIGTRTAPKLGPPEPIEVEWPDLATKPAPKPAWTWWTPRGKELATQWRTTPVVADMNGDKLPDLLMLDHEGYLALFAREKRDGQLVLLPPERVFVNDKGEPLRLNAKTAGGSGRRKLCLVDWDGDGERDLLLNSANADFYRGRGKRDGKYVFEHVGPLSKQNIEGHDVSPTTVDFDGNRIPDFLGGAEDGRFYFLKNPRG